MGAARYEVHYDRAREGALLALCGASQAADLGVNGKTSCSCWEEHPIPRTWPAVRMCSWVRGMPGRGLQAWGRVP